MNRALKGIGIAGGFILVLGGILFGLYEYSRKH